MWGYLLIFTNKKIFFYLFCFFTSISYLISQNNDSLLQHTLNLPQSNQKVDNLLKVGKYFFDNFQSEEGLIYTRDAISISETLHNYRNVIKGKLQLATFYTSINDIESATSQLFEASDYILKAKDDSLTFEIYLKLGESFRSAGVYELSFAYLDKAKNIALKSKDKTNLTKIYNRLAAYYFENPDINQSISKANSLFYAQKALYLAKDINEQEYYINSLNLLGLIYKYKFKDYASARKNLSLGFYLANKLNQIKQLPNLCYNLGSLNIEENNWDSTFFYANLGLQIADSLHSDEFKGLMSKLLSEYYEHKGDFQKAYIYYQTFATLIYDIGKKKETFRLKAILSQQNLKEKELQIKAENKTRTLIIIIAILAILILIVLIIALYSRQKNISRTNKQLQENNFAIEEKNKELDRQNQLIIKQNEELSETNAAKDKLFSIISHDLKNPIGGLKEMIYVFSENLQDFTKEEKEEILHEMKMSSENVLDLLMSLLTWSRSQRGKLEFEPFLQDFKLLVVQNLSMITPLARKKSIQLIDQVQENTHCFFDANMINTVIRNLITNAIKFTPTNGTITISAKLCQKNPDFIEVLISDNGVGIPQDKIENLFKVSQTYTSVGTAGEKGTGLGLLIVKDFINKHNGKIWVESTLNKGTTFHFTIPRSSEVLFRTKT